MPRHSPTRPMAPQGRRRQPPRRTPHQRQYQLPRRITINRIAAIQWWGRLLIQSLGLAFNGRGLRMGHMAPPMAFNHQHRLLQPPFHPGIPGHYWTGPRLNYNPSQRPCLCPACLQRLGVRPPSRPEPSATAAPASPSSTGSQAASSKWTYPLPRTTLERLLDSAVRLPKPLAAPSRNLTISLSHLETRENIPLRGHIVRPPHQPSPVRTRLGHCYRLSIADSSMGPFSGLFPSWVTFPLQLAYAYTRSLLDEAVNLWQVYVSPILAQYTKFEIFFYFCYVLAYMILIGIFLTFLFYGIKRFH